MNLTKSTTEFFVGALIVGAIAAATTLFLTPVSGATIRRQVVNGFSRINGRSSRASTQGRSSTLSKRARGQSGKRSTDRRSSSRRNENSEPEKKVTEMRGRMTLAKSRSKPRAASKSKVLHKETTPHMNESVRHSIAAKQQTKH